MWLFLVAPTMGLVTLVRSHARLTAVIDVSYFSAAAGGTLCSSCAKDVPGAQQLSASEIGWVASLLHLTFDDLLASQIDVTTSTTLVSLAHTWAATHLDARLRAMEFMLSL